MLAVTSAMADTGMSIIGPCSLACSLSLSSFMAGLVARSGITQRRTLSTTRWLFGVRAAWELRLSCVWSLPRADSVLTLNKRSGLHRRRRARCICCGWRMRQ